MIGNKEKLKSLDRFCEIAKKDKYHINVCLAVASVVLYSDDYEATAKELTDLAETSKSADEFAQVFAEKY